MKKLINDHSRVWCLVIILLVGSSPASAQIKTIIPANAMSDSITVNRNKHDTVTFKLNTLPPNAQIDSCSLRFVVKNDVKIGFLMEVHAITPVQGKTRIGTKTIHGGDTRGVPLNIAIESGGFIPKLVNDTYQVVIKTGSVSPGVATLFGTDKEAPGYAPQLIIYYRIPNAPADWGNTNANAQHTSRSYLKTRGVDALDYEEKPIDSKGVVKMDLVHYKDKVYMFSDERKLTTSLFAIDGTSRAVSAIKNDLPAPAGVTAPAVDVRGRLYYATANTVAVFELDNNNAYQSNKITDIGEVNNAIAIGADGSLYIPTSTDVRAYTPFPENRLLWRSPLAGPKSAVSLNREGTIAYVVKSNPGATELVAINANNGERITGKAIVLEGGNAPAPVVDDDGYVYQCNGLESGKKIYVYKPKLDGDATILEDEVKISPPAVLTSIERESSGVYYFKNGVLHRYRTVGGEKRLGAFINLRNAISLLSDGSGNVYAVDADKNFYYYKYGREDNCAPIRLNSVFTKAMTLGIDGTLYAVASQNVLAIKPKAFGADYTISIDDVTDRNLDNLSFKAENINVRDGFTFSQNKVIISKNKVIIGANVTVETGANILIKTGGGVSFGKNFALKKGVALVIKKGY